MKGKKLVQILTGMIAAILLFGMNAFAQTGKEAALAAAKKEVPSGYKLKDSDHDTEDHQWEFEFLSKNKKTSYEVTVHDTTGKVLKTEMEKRYDNGGKKVVLSKSKAKKTVRKVFKGAKIKSVKKKKDDGRYTYKVKFTYKKASGKAEVNAQTGKVIEWTLYY